MSRFFKSDMLAVYVAVLALVASQFPPVHTYFQRPVPDLQLGRNVSVTHYFGNSELVFQLAVSNEGQVPFKIKDIHCMLQGQAGSGVNLVMDGDRYYAERVTPNNLVVGEYFPLAHGLVNDGMSFVVNVVCTSFMPDNSAKRIQVLSNSIEDEQTRLINAGCVQWNNCPTELRDEYVNEAKSIFDENFNFEPGLYELKIEVSYDEGPSTIMLRSFSLTAGDVQKLNALPLYYYRTGGGNIMGRFKTLPVNVALSDVAADS